IVLGSSELYVDNLYNEVAQVLDQITLEMKNENWTPDNYADDGAFGKEVHRRLSIHYQGNTRIRGGMLIDMETREILILEGYNGSGTDTKLQADIVVFEQGYSPQQGDILDPDRTQALDERLGVTAE